VDGCPAAEGGEIVVLAADLGEVLGRRAATACDVAGLDPSELRARFEAATGLGAEYGADDLTLPLANGNVLEQHGNRLTARSAGGRMLWQRLQTSGRLGEADARDGRVVVTVRAVGS
jgi:hypothetical protein